MDNSNSPRFDKGLSEKGRDSYRYDGNSEVVRVEKKSALRIIMQLIFPIIFNVFFFVIGGLEHNASVWMSYGFIHFAYLMLILTPHLIRKGKNSMIFGFALHSVSAAYFFVALVSGIIFILVAQDSYTAALLVQLSIVGLYGLMIIPHMMANEHTAEADEERQNQLEYVKSAKLQLKRILDRVKEKEVKRKVEKAYDAVNSSPVKSHPNLAQMERRILTFIDELEDAVSADNNQAIIPIVDSMLSAINERNNRLKNYHT